MAMQQAQTAKTRKQRKPKRSLRKTPNARTPVSEQESLAIDLSKNEIDAIFKNLYLGNLKNPQAAIGMVYSLALDALQKTLVQGVDEMIRGFADETPGNENPFAPWLAKIIPSDPEKIDAFKKNLNDKLEAAKATVNNKITAACNSDADGPNAVGNKVSFSAEAIRAFLQEPMNETHDDPSGFHSPIARHLSNGRLRELFEEIQMAPPDDGIKRFKLSQLPERYRFSFSHDPAIRTASEPDQAAKDKAQAPPDEISIVEGELNIANADPAAICEDDRDAGESKAATAENDIEAASAIGAQAFENPDGRSEDIIPPSRIPHGVDIRFTPEALVQALGIPNADADAIKSEAMDILGMAVEVSEAMKEIAIEIAQAAVQAYQDEEIAHSLAEALQNDPRLEQDSELSAFVERLESPDESVPDDCAEIDNDELAEAFGKLLDGLEL